MLLLPRRKRRKGRRGSQRGQIKQNSTSCLVLCFNTAVRYFKNRICIVDTVVALLVEKRGQNLFNQSINALLTLWPCWDAALLASANLTREDHECAHPAPGPVASVPNLHYTGKGGSSRLPLCMQCTCYKYHYWYRNHHLCNSYARRSCLRTWIWQPIQWLCSGTEP